MSEKEISEKMQDIMNRMKNRREELNMSYQTLSEKGLKQVYVANKAGYTKQMLSDMITGRRLIKVNDIIRIAPALGVDANYLFGIEKGE